MKKLIGLSLVVVVSTGLSFSVLASGGYSGGSGYSGSRSNTPNQRSVDTVYETGKAIYKGRKQGEPALAYCVASGDEKIPVKRKSLKGFKKKTYNDLAQNLFNCDQPETLIANELSKDSLLYVLYYLNKRHKLNLVSR